MIFWEFLEFLVRTAKMKSVGSKVKPPSLFLSLSLVSMICFSPYFPESPLPPPPFLSLPYLPESSRSIQVFTACLGNDHWDDARTRANLACFPRYTQFVFWNIWDAGARRRVDQAVGRRGVYTILRPRYSRKDLKTFPHIRIVCHEALAYWIRASAWRP